MKLSIMKSKKKVIFTVLSILFWFLAWELLALLIDISIVLPGPSEVIVSLGNLVITLSFWKILLFSFIRIIIGFIIGVVLGISHAIQCNSSSVAMHLFSPVMTIIRATPVASFIMVLWLIIGSNLVPSAITVLMVTPIIWQNLIDGFSAIDKNLDEVCTSFEISAAKRFKILIAPTLTRFLIPAIITSAGLGWKSGIAAEIIAYTSNSIGKEIFLSKSFLESAEMLAWTLVVIILSLSFEFVISYLGKKVSNNAAYAEKNN